MPLRHMYPFMPVRGTTAASFNSTSLGPTSTFVALESTALGRVWAGPTGRAIRLCESSGIDYFIALGTSTVEAASSDSMKILGGTVETFHVAPGQTHIAVLSGSSTTAAEVNVTLGYGE